MHPSIHAAWFQDGVTTLKNGAVIGRIESAPPTRVHAGRTASRCSVAPARRRNFSRRVALLRRPATAPHRTAVLQRRAEDCGERSHPPSERPKAALASPRGTNPEIPVAPAQPEFAPASDCAPCYPHAPGARER